MLIPHLKRKQTLTDEIDDPELLEIAPSWAKVKSLLLPYFLSKFLLNSPIFCSAPILTT